MDKLHQHRAAGNGARHFCECGRRIGPKWRLDLDAIIERTRESDRPTGWLWVQRSYGGSGMPGFKPNIWIHANQVVALANGDQPETTFVYTAGRDEPWRVATSPLVIKRAIEELAPGSPALAGEPAALDRTKCSH